MKTNIILALALCVSYTLTHASTAFNINPGVLTNKPDVAFQGGSATVRFSTGDFFKMQGFGDRVEMQSLSLKDWSFDNKVIYTSELPFADIYNIRESDILTIVATARHDNMTQYSVGVIKYLKQGRVRLRAVSASIIPEIAAFPLILGLLAVSLLVIRRKGR